jgi:4-amino-4-deoxy-L-arabinose transferase-like glycosyltransferase
MHNKAILVIIAISLILGVSLLTRGHIWGDDFASYVMQAESILDGTTDEFVEHNSFTIFESSNQIGPVAYPWGYPLILTPAYAIKGNHPLTLKLPGLFFYAGFLPCLFLLMKTHMTSTESLLITALFAFNPLLLQFLDLIASDIPFLFFSTLALLFMIQRERPAAWQNLALGAAIAGAFFIRTTGILLLASFLAMQLIQMWNNKTDRETFKKLSTDGLLAVGSFGILWMLYAIVFPGGGESYFAQYQGFAVDTAAELTNSYFQVFRQFFGENVVWKILYPVFIVFFLLGIWIRFKDDLVFILFFIFWMVVLITWPFWQGPRFIFPLLPIFIYFTFVGMKFILEKLPAKHAHLGQWAHYGFWTLIAILFLITSSTNAYVNLQSGRAINGPYDDVSKEVYRYIQDETSEDSVIIFFKPRAMRLMTSRDSILSTDCEGILKGDYLVLSRKVGKNQQIPPEEIDACNLPLSEVLKNNRFIVYKIQK